MLAYKTSILESWTKTSIFPHGKHQSSHIFFYYYYFCIKSINLLTLKGKALDTDDLKKRQGNGGGKRYTPNSVNALLIATLHLSPSS